MMRMSKKIDYGLILLRDLIQGGTAMSAREIADKHRLPVPMAANILKALAGAGILASQRGAQGGYALARHAARISLAEIVEALEGPFNLVDCVSSDASCQLSGWCPTHDPMQVVHRRFKDFMAGLSLQEILGLDNLPLTFKVSADENAYLPG